MACSHLLRETDYVPALQEEEIGRDETICMPRCISASHWVPGIALGLTRPCLKEGTLVSLSHTDLLRCGLIYARDFHVQNSFYPAPSISSTPAATTKGRDKLPLELQGIKGQPLASAVPMADT